MHFKETTPMDTVTKLKDILNRLNIETEEYWQEESSIGTYALRVIFKGTGIGTNGKGVSKEYALASAYAEFFERYQNDLLGPRVYFKNDFLFKLSPDEKIMTAEEIAKEDNAFMRMYFSERGLENASIDEKANAFRSVQKIDYHVYGDDDCYITLPFYSIRNKRVEYLPKSTYTPFYGSNGMCAGNTPEEAIVQGLAEIIERFVQKKIFLEKPAPPDIPKEYIAKFPYVFEMFNKLKSNKNYLCMLKDCSTGSKYPVAALVVLEKNTGSYGIKFGCHPDFGVAMERTFTEATQGQNIFEYAKRSHIDFKNESTDNWRNIYNSYKIGIGKYPYQIFSSEFTYPFTPVKDVSAMSNKELMEYWIKEILDDGYDILIRDVSNLGFPSYHIIIPVLSEMMYPDDFKFRAINTRYYVSALLNERPEKIGKKESKYIIGTMEYFLGNAFENTMSSYYPVVDTNDIPCENIGAGCIYMIAMCHVLNGNYEAAAERMRFVIACAKKHDSEVSNPTEKVTPLYAAIKNYFSAMAEFDNHEKSMKYMTLLFDEDICEKIDSLFSKPEEVIRKQYPCAEIHDGKSNLIYYRDRYHAVSDYTKKLKTVQRENAISQEALGRLFC